MELVIGTIFGAGALLFCLFFIGAKEVMEEMAFEAELKAKAENGPNKSYTWPGWWIAGILILAGGYFLAGGCDTNIETSDDAVYYTE